MSDGGQRRRSDQRAEHRQEAEPDSSWLSGACTLAAAEGSVSMLQTTCN